MDGATPRIALSGISKRFGTGDAKVRALIDVDLPVNPGEVVGLLGPSGSGKSAWLNIIGCILEPSGRMALDGEAVYDGHWLSRDLRRLRLTRLGFIFRFHNLIPFLTAPENVALVLEPAWSWTCLRRSPLVTHDNKICHRPARIFQLRDGRMGSRES